MEDFRNHLNSRHPAVKFTREVEENSSIVVLDTLVTRTEDSLSLSVYNTPYRTDQYLQSDSDQTLQHYSA